MKHRALTTAAVCGLLVSGAWAQPAYQVHPLATPHIPGVDVNATWWQTVGATAAGEVVMNVQWSQGTALQSRAVRTSAISAAVLPGERDGNTVARALRDDGYVFGLDLSSSQFWPRQETAWRDGQRVLTDTLTGVVGLEVWGGAGDRLFGTVSSDAVVLQNGTVTPVRSSFSTGGSGPYLTAISANGYVAGVDFVAGDSRASVWENGVQRLLPMPADFAGSFLQDVFSGAINSNGVAVGTLAYSTNAGLAGGTFLWHAAGFTMISDVYHGNQRATISDAGHVVTRDLDGTLLWIDGVTYRPHDLATPGFAGTITSIDRIELDGRIIGQAIVDGERVPVIMTTIPAPGVLAMAIASAWCSSRRRRRK